MKKKQSWRVVHKRTTGPGICFQALSGSVVPKRSLDQSMDGGQSTRVLQAHGKDIKINTACNVKLLIKNGNDDKSKTIS